MSKIAPHPSEAHFCTFSFAGSFFSPWVLVTNRMIVFPNTAPSPLPLIASIKNMYWRVYSSFAFAKAKWWSYTLSWRILWNSYLIIFLSIYNVLLKQVSFRTLQFNHTTCARNQRAGGFKSGLLGFYSVLHQKKY